ncbi:hypothetical protein L1987_08049 [Smallanthus sonchifolius]|uniref:Uncharacterized protein n=1 Tax=Smallanthus sonchifolius TaxID=185202 RepID=A0ACB9JLB6_9ASTR|nr:hypothetical protein L1987_08049 [Smallanthus sonchifolius]
MNRWLFRRKRLLTGIFRDVGECHGGELGTTVRELRLVLSLPLFTAIRDSSNPKTDLRLSMAFYHNCKGLGNTN